MYGIEPPRQMWFTRPANLVIFYEVPILAALLGMLTAIAALIWQSAYVDLCIVSAWCFGLAIAWLSGCVLRMAWTKTIASLVIGVSFIAIGNAIARTEPPPPPWMHIGTITIGKEPAGGGVRMIARVEFENDSDDPATVVMPSAWLFAKAEDGLSIGDAATRVRTFAAAAPVAAPAFAGPHVLHHYYIIGPVLAQPDADDEIRNGARFFVAGTIAMHGARPDTRATFCAFAGATASGAIDATAHDCPAP